MRRIVLVVLSGALIAAVAAPAPSAVATAAYRARGTVALTASSPGPPESARGSVALSPAYGRTGVAVGPAPSGGSMSFTGAVRVAYPSSPCRGAEVSIGFTVAWNDGTTSAGTGTLLFAPPVATLLATIRSGRLAGALLEIVSPVKVAPGPPDCEVPLGGEAVLTAAR
jgi:hypothetical protein